MTALVSHCTSIPSRSRYSVRIPPDLLQVSRLLQQISGYKSRVYLVAHFANSSEAISSVEKKNVDIKKWNRAVILNHHRVTVHRENKQGIHRLSPFLSHLSPFQRPIRRDAILSTILYHACIVYPRPRKSRRWRFNERKGPPISKHRDKWSLSFSIGVQAGRAAGEGGGRGDKARRTLPKVKRESIHK